MTGRLQEFMDKPINFEIRHGDAIFRATGKVSVEQAAELTTSAIAYAREQHIEKLLIDVTGLFGFEPPNLAYRYFLTRELADAARGQVCIAFVTRREMMDPQQLGTTVAENDGLRICGFESEEEALAWLKSVKWAAQTEEFHFTYG